MSISTGVGLISGINTADLIDQLMAIESRPKTLITNRNTVLSSQQVAFQEVNAKLLAFKLKATALSNANTFSATSGASSNESVLGVTTTRSAVPGTYNFTVDRLVTTQQTITSGYADADATPVGAGTLTFEFGDGKLESDTALRRLNGGEGVTRGKIRITDRSGATAVVDLSKAITVDDVLEAINTASGINVSASIGGDGLVLTDLTGAVTSNLRVDNVGTTNTATSLGLAGNVAASSLTGAAINTIGRKTQLTDLNDGNGVRVNGSAADFRVTTRDGASFDVNLSTADTLGEVIDAINAASGGSVTASVGASGVGLSLLDNTAGGGTFTLAALNSSNALADLGLTTGDGDNDGDIDGERLVAALNSKLLANLNGGSGVTFSSDDRISITNRNGAATVVDLTGARSISEVVDRINNAGAGVTASLNSVGSGLLLSDGTGGTGNLIVADVAGTLATDLGLAGSVAADSVDSGNLQVQYINEATRLSALNGGAGITRGKFTLTDSSGASATVDLTQGDELTVGDVIAEINSRGLAVNARINDTGDGILIEDTGPGTVAIAVTESGSRTAKDLGILGAAASAGADIDGTFERTITIAADDTLNDVRDKLNNAGFGLRATVINDGSGTNGYRLSIQAGAAGKAGAFLLDDGGIGLGATNLVEAQDSVVFFGNSDPAKSLAIIGTSNALSTVVPGATINLKGVGSATVTVSRDDSAVTKEISGFVDAFNGIIDTFNKYDTYNPDTNKRGLLLGDGTLAQVRNSLYRLLNNRNGDVQGQFASLTQVGLRVGTGAKLVFDEAKFLAALDEDRAAVVQLFSLKETQTDATTNETTITAGGVAVRIDQLLANLTDASTGLVPGRVNTLSDQIDLNNDRIAAFDKLLAQKRDRLERQFAAMESALADIQGQSSALTQLSNLAASLRSS
jgi:flagellar hook-associated protein 2